MNMVYGKETLPPRVIAVETHPNYTITVTFDDGARRLYDMRPLFETPLYRSLPEVFDQASVDCGTVVWPGNLDISPDTLYLDGKPIV